MFFRLFSFLFFATLVFSCQKTYKCEDVEFRNGYTYETGTDTLANGKLECIENRSEVGRYIHETYTEYENGKQVGEWRYLVQGDIIHHGEIIPDEELENMLCEKFQADYISADIWYEGDFPFFDLSIINVTLNLDSLQIQNIVNTDLKAFMTSQNIDNVTLHLYSNNVWVSKSYELQPIFLNKSFGEQNTWGIIFMKHSLILTNSIRLI